MTDAAKTIVIIEDNKELSRMYERVFRLHGYNVVTHFDGEGALRELTALDHMPSAIIMDVIIPSMSGLDLLRHLRSDRRFDDVPILILTNSLAKGDERQFLALGADRYLVKIEHQAEEVVQNVETLIQKHAASEKPHRVHSGEKIFIAEDDEYISRVYERAFRLAGYELAIASDGEAALKDLATMDPKPAVIILDILLPKVNGEDLLKNIKANARFEHIPVVILTNSFHTDDMQKFLALGASLFLLKIDNTPSQVVEKIGELIHNRTPPVGAR